MKAKDVMTHAVVSVAPGMPIGNAIARMIAHQVSGLPVVDDEGRLVGMVTEGDFLRRPELDTEAPRQRWLELLLGPASGAEAYARSHGRTVRDVMSAAVVTLDPQASLDEVANLMEEHAVKRMPVVEAGRVVGIVSRADLMYALTQFLSPAAAAAEDDAAIRRRIQAEMKRQAWCPFHAVRVHVRGGVAELTGTIYDEGQRRALRVLAENVAGVKAVHDRLQRVEPLGGPPDDAAPGASAAVA